MSIEQTSQLLQLILNSLLLAIGGGLLLQTLSRRRSRLEDRLHTVACCYANRRESSHDLSEQPSLSQMRKQFQILQRRHQRLHTSSLAGYYALLLALGSALLLALRTLVDVDGLISASMLLFVGAILALLASSLLAIGELYPRDRPCLDDLASGRDYRHQSAAPAATLPPNRSQPPRSQPLREKAS